MDPRRSPQRIGNAHLQDKLAYLQRNCWPAATMSRLPAPVRPETSAMPTDAGFTIARAFRTVGVDGYTPAKIIRSAVLKVGLFGEFRRNTLI